MRFVFKGNDARTHLCLGVTRKDLESLQRDKAIYVVLDEMQPGLVVDGTVMIYFGETVRDLHNLVVKYVTPPPGEPHA